MTAMLDENGFERSAPISRWIIVAIWASVPLAAVAFGLAIVAMFDIGGVARGRDVAAARPAHDRQARPVAPQAPVVVAEAEAATPLRISSQTVRQEAPNVSFAESMHDIAPGRFGGNGPEWTSESFGEAVTPPRMEGDEAASPHLRVESVHQAEREPPSRQFVVPQDVEPQAPRWATVDPASAALLLPPVVVDPGVASVGQSVLASNPPPVADRLHAQIPAAVNLNRSQTAVVRRESVVASLSAPSRVFIHRATNARDDASEALARRLGQQGIVVAAIRPVRATPSTPEIRYFYEADKARAMDLAGRLTGPAWRVRDFLAYEKLPRPGTLEVWLPNGMTPAAN